MDIFTNEHKDFEGKEFTKAFPTQTLAMKAARENKAQGFTTTVSKVAVKKMPSKELICALVNDTADWAESVEEFKVVEGLKSKQPKPPKAVKEPKEKAPKPKPMPPAGV